MGYLQVIDAARQFQAVAASFIRPHLDVLALHGDFSAGHRCSKGYDPAFQHCPGRLGAVPRGFRFIIGFYGNVRVAGAQCYADIRILSQRIIDAETVKLVAVFQDLQGVRPGDHIEISRPVDTGRFLGFPIQHYREPAPRGAILEHVDHQFIKCKRMSCDA